MVMTMSGCGYTYYFDAHKHDECQEDEEDGAIDSDVVEESSGVAAYLSEQ